MDAADGVPDLDAVNARLEPVSGWRLIAVPGFIPDEQFFRHLAARRFPVTVWLREPEEFDYLVEPDIFHDRSEEHTSELQSLMRISYAVFCLKKKKHKITTYTKYTPLI